MFERWSVGADCGTAGPQERGTGSARPAVLRHYCAITAAILRQYCALTAAIDMFQNNSKSKNGRAPGKANFINDFLKEMLLFLFFQGYPFAGAVIGLLKPPVIKLRV